MLLALTPGVIFTQEQFGASGFSGTRGWDTNNGYKINGGRPGTVVGGPIRKNKDFVFGSFVGWREVIPLPTVSDTVPNFLRNGQNFGQYKMYDPLTTRPCGQGPDNC